MMKKAMRKPYLSLLAKTETTWGRAPTRLERIEQVVVHGSQHVSLRHVVYRLGCMRFICLRLNFGSKPHLKLLLEDQ
jgi:hypothetical protein